MEKLDKNKIYIGAVFIIFASLLFRNITAASLWIDEGIEYWYSKSIHAVLPWEDSISTMYERILRTYQPPLYNIIMYIWLKINDGEIWFRTFGVVMGLGCGIAVYRTISKISNDMIALVAVLFLGNIYRFVYYIQECAEYNLLLFNLCWMIFYFIESVRNSSIKNIFLFTVFGVLAVYSQYGAVLAVIGFAVTLFIWNVIKKEKHAVKTLFISYSSAIFLAAIPLYIFFAKEQIRKRSANGKALAINSDDNILVEFIKCIRDTVDFNFVPIGNLLLEKIIYLLVVLVFVMALYLIHKKDNITIAIILASIFTFMIYFVFVKLGVYPVSTFNNRYSLFMLPVIFLCAAVILGRFFLIYTSNIERGLKTNFISMMWGIVIGAVCIYSIIGFQIIGKNWAKEDNKAMFRNWYKQVSSDDATIVYYGAVPTFCFYLEHEENYISSEMLSEDNGDITLQPSLRNLSKQEYIEYFTSIYDSGFPKEILFLCSHYIVDDWQVMLEALNELGYEYEVTWSGADAQIVRLQY